MLKDKILVFILCVATGQVNCKYTSADYLKSLDDVICRYINEPTAEASEHLYEDLDLYKDALESLLECVKAKDISVQEAVINYWASGKPRFTQDNEVWVYKKMQSFLRFTDLEMGKFFGKIEEVKSMWDKFKEECEKDIEFCAPPKSGERKCLYF